MIVVITKGGPSEQVAARLAERGARYQSLVDRAERWVYSVDGPAAWSELFEGLAGVEAVHVFDGPWGLVSRAIRPESTTVTFGRVTVGGPEFAVIAGPCSVESRPQLEAAAAAVLAAGGHALRGGAFKPRTSPHHFQGLGAEGLEHLSSVGRRTGLPVVTEVMAPADVPLVARHADVLQVGSRNVQNFRLLEAVGCAEKPVLLKRGMMSTLDEFLAAAEYVYLRGNTDIILCERGIRTFEPRMRNTLDLGAVALLKRLTHLPVIVDPSHGSGLSELVPDLARAALAVGADGLLVEVHPRPELALSDGRQSLDPTEFAALMKDLGDLASALGRPLPQEVQAVRSASDDS